MSNSKEWKWGYILPNGDFSIAPKFDGASGFYEGLAAVKVDWARGYIDKKGDFAIQPIFEAAGDFTDGVAEVKIDGETRYINKEGIFQDNITVNRDVRNQIETGFNPHYELHDGLMRFVENEKFGYKDKDGKVVIKPQFFDAMDFSEGLACVKKGKTGAWGYIDVTGKMVIPAKFKQSQSFHEGLAAVLTSAE